MEFTREELYTVTIWVKLPGLNFKYWGLKDSKIGSMIGKPLMADKNTERKIGLNFARLLIEVDVDSPLPDKVFFKMRKGPLWSKEYSMIGSLCYASIAKSMATLRRNVEGRSNHLLLNSTRK